MRGIKQIKNLKNKVILLRAGFDVPMKNGRVVDSKRIEVLLPTIKYLVSKGPLVILSHQGRPGGKRNLNFSQKPIVPVLEKLLKMKVKFADNCVGAKTEKIAKALKRGEILLLENLRFESGEEKNDQSFAKKLARLGDVYVNDAFPDAHREHASIVSLPKYLPNYAGFQLEAEVKNLSRVFKPKHPFLFILGGAKFETKMPLIKKYLKLADHVFVGGALANDFLKAKGYDVGKSLTSDTGFGIKELLTSKKLILPVDFVFKNKIILDIGDKSIKNLTPLIKKAKLILWNGPLGEYEDGGAGATKKILKLVAASNAESIVGGGDTIALISKMKMEKKFSFVSTGGGATLDFLAYGTLPGIKALE